MFQKPGLVFHVAYRKEAPGPQIWQTAVQDLEQILFNLQNLDAFSTYHINVTAWPKLKSAYPSQPVNVTCVTRPTWPEQVPGLVPGAFEEMGNGIQRQVTLYWQVWYASTLTPPKCTDKKADRQASRQVDRQATRTGRQTR